ncbi:MAG: hydrolase 2, exosortase A system-associated [Burkholderiales bacterium]|nr:hydrolase 2, exosortase A system-associated [Burkholderiales bacterium]
MHTPEPAGTAEAFFLPRDGGGQRYCLLHRPPAGMRVRGALLYVHPWCEEMNKSRRMAALQARDLAARGWWVLQIDLLGCGDSSGDFGDARWAAWIDDVRAAARWLRERVDAPLWLWGLRVGTLLAADAVRDIEGVHGLLLWQPLAAGRSALQQFLLLLAAGAMQSGAAGAALREARAAFAAGQEVDVAGYTLAPGLAAALEGATLEVPARVRAIALLEVQGGGVPAAPTPTLARLAQAWQAAGHEVRHVAVVGPAFWQTTEIEDAPELIAATVRALQALEEPKPTVRA